MHTDAERVARAIYAIRQMMGTHTYSMTDLLVILEDG